eukprot:7249141-Prymnesium_polylepis.1
MAARRLTRQPSSPSPLQTAAHVHRCEPPSSGLLRRGMDHGTMAHAACALIVFRVMWVEGMHAPCSHF